MQLHVTPDIHTKLKSGVIGSLCDAPFRTNSTTVDAASSPRSASATGIPMDVISPTEEGVSVDDNDKENNAENSWDIPVTKYLLSVYLEQREKFRNPLIKKIPLFRDSEKNLLASAIR